MKLPPIRRMAIPLIGSVGVGAIALAFGIQALRREPPIDSKAGSTPATVTRAGSDAHDQKSATPASTRAKTDSVVSGPSGQRKAAEGGTGGPTFDIASIDPTGEAVIAGRAVPGASVDLIANGKVYGQAVADQAGEFVIVPHRLPSGSYDLTLRSKQADGALVTSRQTVAVSVQARADERPTAAASTPDKPAPVQPQPVAPRTADETVAVDAIKSEPDGHFHVSGRAPRGATVKLYLNDSFVASATAGADEHFAFTINEGVKPGDYRVRLDAVEPNSGAVHAHAEAAFNVPATAAAASVPAATMTPTQAVSADEMQKQETADASASSANEGSPSAVVVPKIATTTVVRGDNLWNISRHTYGDGTRYPDIVGANREHIRDPNLIYPGQIFVLPNE